MSQLTRILSVWLASVLIVIIGSPLTLGQTVPRERTDDLTSFLQRSDQPTQQIDQFQQANRSPGEGPGRFGEVPATGASYLVEAVTGQGDQSASNQEVKAGTLWDEDPSWRPYIEASFRGGSAIDRGEVDLFMPLIWSDTSLLFADLRGGTGDTGHHEGNWALASRQRTPAGWILGAWGSYDLRESETGNHFDQAAFGVEMMSRDLDFRFNGYVPTSLESQLVPGEQATAAISRGNIVVRSNRELAYWGVDGEFGLLLWSNDPSGEGEETWYSSLDAELRWFAGGYYFDNPTSGFDSITGPRVRAELRMYDLSLLGNGSRLTLEGMIQDDRVRGTQAEAGVYVRIPFGPRPQRRLDRMGRRMVDRIVRDADVIAHHQVINEAASFASNGMAISTASVVNSGDDLSAQVAAAGRTSLVVVDGSEGAISESETTVLSQGQVVLGGGMTLSVIGSDTGVQAEFEAPGERPTVTGTDVTADVFEIADDTSLIGLDISGGNNGVSGENVTGFTLSDLEARGAVKDGFHLIGDVNGTVRGNRAAENGDDGFQFENFNGGTLSDNTASENGFGFFVGELNGGTVSENTAESNVADGFLLLETNGGTLSDNIANSNGNGFTLTDVNGGNLTGNSASSNDEQGFEVGFFNGGELSGNTGSANGGNGFQVDFLTGGTLSDNTATANSFGFLLGELNGGTLSDNTANSNGNGFLLFDFNGGNLTGNTASSNELNGFEVGFFNGGTL
ncbi:MAG: NosD domain-containing protein, partial [Planctomycetota bacterium]|nr:NosD domain-containing protein [Planctomycetota bacterium]